MLFGPGLRTKETEAEKVLWQRLRSARIGYKFRRQVDIGPYVVDFCCFSKKLIIELDGEFHKRIDRRIVDRQRTQHLEKLGYVVIRFWNQEVINDVDEIIRKINILTSRNSGSSLSVDTERGIR